MLFQLTHPQLQTLNIKSLNGLSNNIPSHRYTNNTYVPDMLISQYYSHFLKSQISLLNEFRREEHHFMIQENTEKSCSQLLNNSKKIKKSKQTGPCGESHIQNYSNRQQRSAWSPDEDAQVIDLVKIHGQRWTQIALVMGRRTGKQIRDRYMHKLRPGIDTRDWSAEEDAILISLYDKYGAKWAQIVRYMPNRTENQVKNRFNSKHSQHLQDDLRYKSI